MTFALIAHVVACVWIIGGRMNSSETNSWIFLHYEEPIADVSLSDLYLTSFYFTITTITTVGYGDFSAKT